MTKRKILGFYPGFFHQRVHCQLGLVAEDRVAMPGSSNGAVITRSKPLANATSLEISSSTSFHRYGRHQAKCRKISIQIMLISGHTPAYCRARNQRVLRRNALVDRDLSAIKKQHHNWRISLRHEKQKKSSNHEFYSCTSNKATAREAQR